MPTIENRRHINASPQAIWDLMSDIKRGPEWVTVMQELISVDKYPLEEGATYVEKSKIGPSVSNTAWRIARFEPPHIQVHECEEPTLRARLTVTVTPAGDGGQLTHRVDYQMLPAFRPLGWLLEMLFGRRLMRREMARSVDQAVQLLDRTTLPEKKESRRRQHAFYGLVLLFIGLFGAMLTLMVPILPLLFTGWFAGAELASHQLHDIMAAALFWVILVGMIIQLKRPANQSGALLQSLAALLSLNGAIILGRFAFPPMLVFLALALVIAWLHPRRGRLLPRPLQLNRPALALALLAAGPFLWLAADQVGLQGLQLANDIHGEVGHWAIIGGYALTTLLLALVAALRPAGYRLPAWSSGILAILLGVASLALADVASALDPAWAILAILWGAAFIVASEHRRAVATVLKPSIS